MATPIRQIQTSDNVVHDIQGVEYIVGTQTAATNAWKGVTKVDALYTGQVIAYKLPYTGITGSGTTLALTVSGGSTVTKNVYINNDSNPEDTYPANSVVILIYDGTSWRTAESYANIQTQTSTFVKSYPGVTTRITPVGSTANAIATVATSGTVAAVTSASVTPTSFSITVTNGELYIGSTVALSSVELSADTTSVATGITYSTTAFAKAGTALDVLTGLGTASTGIAVTSVSSQLADYPAMNGQEF